jgi:hypothetical protein
VQPPPAAAADASPAEVTTPCCCAGSGITPVTAKLSCCCVLRLLRPMLAAGILKVRVSPCGPVLTQQLSSCTRGACAHGTMQKPACSRKKQQFDITVVKLNVNLQRLRHASASSVHSGQETTANNTTNQGRATSPQALAEPTCASPACRTRSRAPAHDGGTRCQAARGARFHQ